MAGTSKRTGISPAKNSRNPDRGRRRRSGWAPELGVGLIGAAAATGFAGFAITAGVDAAATGFAVTAGEAAAATGFAGFAITAGAAAAATGFAISAGVAAAAISSAATAAAAGTAFCPARLG